MSGRTTIATVVAGFDQLQRVGFNRPKIPRDVGALAEAYLEHLKDLPEAAVLDGVAAYIREGARFWPTVAEWRKAALAARRVLAADQRSGATGAYWAWEKRGRRTEDGRALAPCPVCDALPAESGRLVIHHDHQRHLESGVLPYVRDQGT